jgi:multidrug efflux pump subunit AcrA (membrane-fusion protein)
MSSPSESSATTNPTPDSPPANGFTPPGLLTETSAKSRKLPSQGRRRRWIAPVVIGGVLLFAALGVAGWWFFLRATPARADVLLHTVKREPLVVTVTEKGTLESAGNRDLICKVRAGNKGFATSINWVIDDGTRVQPGQQLMILDDSDLLDKRDTKLNDYTQALNNKIKSEKDYEIQLKQNQKDIAAAQKDLTNALNALRDYLGFTYDPTRHALAAIGGGPLALSESGTYRQAVDDQIGKVKQAEGDLEQYRERSAWSDRMVKLSYMSLAQAQAARSQLDSAIESLRSQRAKLTQMLVSDRERDLTSKTLDCEIFQITLDQVTLSAQAKLVQLEAALKRDTLLLEQQTRMLREIDEQIAECKVVAPDDIEPNSMVVYFKSESNRFNTSNTGMIEQGAQVKEGQKMLRIPNLHRMQVNTKVHEAMVARIRGDVRVPTHVIESAQQVMVLNTDPFLRVVTQHQGYISKLRDRAHSKGLQDYRTTSAGQRATIRVDALPGRVFEGHVSTVSSVASQVDAWISDVKLYQTLVTIDAEVLPDGTKRPLNGEEIKPDMTAEVSITVDTAKDPVLTVPVQAIIGGAEMGARREVFIKTPTGYERREVTLGLYNEKVVEIREGLAEHDEVVLNPKVLLAPEDKTRTRDDGGKNSKGGNGKGGDWKGGKGGGGDYPKDGNQKGPGGPGETKGGGGKKGFSGGGPPPSN